MTQRPVKGARRVTRLALLTAIALTIFMVEAQIPVAVPIPGVKLGLANIVTVYTVFALGAGDALLVLVIRGGGSIVPSGNTILREGDIAVLSAPAFRDETMVSLIEVEVNKNSRWKGKRIMEYSPAENELVIMIKRGQRIIIPRGSTIIREGDILVINSPKKVNTLKNAK